MEPCVNIHTHRPAGYGIELRTAGVHPWEPDLHAAERLAEVLGAQLANQSGPSDGSSASRSAAEVPTVGMRVPEKPNGRELDTEEPNRRERDTENPTRTTGSAESRDSATGPALRIRTAGLAAEWVEVTEVAAAGIQAIGEIGLDFACRSDRTLQTEVLRIQLRLAHRTGLPVVLHCVRAFEPLMRELAACQPREVIFHGFIGSPEQARTALSHGCYLSFGERTFASPKSLRALHEVPLDRLFLETDDAPVSIERIYDRAARELGLEVGVLRRATYENYKRIFEPKHENG